MMFIRHVSGAKNTVVDWLSRMHAYLSSERGLCMMSEEHGDIGCLMSCLLALKEEDEVLNSVHVHFSDVFEVRQEGNPERVVMTFDEMFKQVYGGRKLHFGARRCIQDLASI